MKRSDEDKRRVAAMVKILEGETVLLQDTIDEAMHWNEPNDVIAAICRIRDRAAQIAQALDLPPPV